MAVAANRRVMLAGVGSAAVLSLAGTVSAASGSEKTMHLSGTVSYAEKGPLPAGILKIRLEEQGVMDRKAERIAEVEVKSGGQHNSVPFEMQVPRAALEKAVRPGFRVRLERADGWLLAINTGAKFYEGGQKVSLTVNPVIY
ncbi:YbaY family lipoprotein [Mesorhizobium sp. LHD-90]|uniref:YbaY family lipoprotein n=1 Tax=Mesorhizobium sp. LHD-90 TaxID=3071414 RepID=UPI0027E1B6EE|nr:YbaY family lipoprotein [Mesorhizobium sp. LHD-90]MDQ6437411.1 YbaY family lipoprotein [Mesorhizobium sp. LHD-90]